jgi:hypothetical protein
MKNVHPYTTENSTKYSRISIVQVLIVQGPVLSKLMHCSQGNFYVGFRTLLKSVSLCAYVFQASLYCLVAVLVAYFCVSLYDLSIYFNVP